MGIVPTHRKSRLHEGETEEVPAGLWDPTPFKDLTPKEGKESLGTLTPA